MFPYSNKRLLKCTIVIEIESPIPNVVEASATKAVGVRALMLDCDGQVLVVKPVAKPGWQLPGGGTEKWESPSDAWKREVKEELGLNLVPVAFLGAEYDSSENYEGIHFVFFGGRLAPSDREAIVLPPNELSEHRWVALDEAVTLLATHRPGLALRLPTYFATVETRQPPYFENDARSM